MKNKNALREIRHPLIIHKMGLLRQASLEVSHFRVLVKEIAAMLTYEVTRDLPLESSMVEGWAGPVNTQRIAGKKLTVVPILRAGLGMLEGITQSIPSIKVSIVGMYRNEKTLQPVNYYCKLCKEIDKRTALIVDPMLATGGSMIEAITVLKEAGCKDIRAIVLVAAPEGIKAVHEQYPDIPIYTASVDEKLNKDGYILPGLGDAGDRLFGTI